MRQDLRPERTRFEKRSPAPACCDGIGTSKEAICAGVARTASGAPIAVVGTRVKKIFVEARYDSSRENIAHWRMALQTLAILEQRSRSASGSMEQEKAQR